MVERLTECYYSNILLYTKIEHSLFWGL